jgi:hypothetical protein
MTDARRPSRWEWIAAARAIRDGRTEPPEPGSLSAELAGELGGHRGDDPLNDRADEAAQWCELIMKSERRERLLAQYFSTGSDWLLNRLRGVLDDCWSYNPSDRPMFCHTAGEFTHPSERGGAGAERRRTGCGMSTRRVSSRRASPPDRSPAWDRRHPNQQRQDSRSDTPGSRGR